MCIFCDIVEGKIPVQKIFENDLVLVFLDHRPINTGHALVIPKTHYANLEEVSEEALIAVALAIKKIGGLLKTKLAVPGYNVCENNDGIAGQEVPHLHFQVIPRQENDGISHQWPHREYNPGEAEEIIKKLLT